MARLAALITVYKSIFELQLEPHSARLDSFCHALGDRIDWVYLVDASCKEMPQQVDLYHGMINL